jgi:hypothetical protein
MSFARTLASIASIIVPDAGNNLTSIGNISVGNSTVNSGNVLQVAGNVAISGSTNISNAIIINSISTFNNQTTVTGPVTINGSTIFSKARNESKGAAVASASTTDIWTNADGNLLHVTGTTTITNLGTAQQAGIRRTVIFDGALILTYNASTLVLPGATNATVAAGDVWEFIADTTTKIIGSPVSVSKLPSVDGTVLTNIPKLNSVNNFTGDQHIARTAASALNMTNTIAPGITGNATAATQFFGYNASSAQKLYGQIYTYLQNATAAAESSWIVLANTITGTYNWRFAIGAGLFSQNASGGDKGVDTVNVKSYFKDGVQQFNDTLQWITIPATADFSVTSNTTLQSHPQLQIAITSGVSYDIIFDLYLTAPTTGGLKVTVAGPTSSRFAGMDIWATTDSGSLSAGNDPEAAFPMVIDGGSASHTGGNYHGRASFTASANGTVIVQMAQQTSNATSTVMHKASRLRYRVV